MKRNFTMIIFGKIIRTLCFSLLLTALIACESPFKAGLGAVVDLHPPQVFLESPSAGTYLWGTQEFTGYAEDDYHLVSVQFRVTSHGEKIQKPDGTEVDNPYFDWAELLENPSGYFRIRFDIDTTIFNDGDLTVKLRAKDRADNITEIDDVAYHVKNDPPTINLSLPVIEKLAAGADPASAMNYGKLGSERLNWDFFRDREVGIVRRMDSEGRMVGVISDSRGVNKHGNTEDRYPPQIRFWQIRQDTSQTSDEYENIRMFDHGYMPLLEEVPWENLRHLEDLGLHEVQFGYDLPKASGKLFAFQVRAMSLDDRGTSFIFPKDHWTLEHWNSLPDHARDENSVVLLNLNTPDEFPTVDVWGMENIDQKDAWNSSTGYEMIDIDLNEYNPYFNEAITVKNGPFILRVKTSHSMGIYSSAVYFERDSEYRGRFIWDEANEGPDGWDGWNKDRDSVSIGRSYTEWGRNDPFSVDGNLPPRVRNFIFTYRDKPEIIPQNQGYNAAVAGRARVQLYKGSRWLANGSLNTNMLEDVKEEGDNWIDLPGGRLEEGEYKLRVTARSSTGTPIPTPREFTLKLDRTPPEIELTGFRGCYEEYDNDGALYRVNGVVEPRFHIDDSHTASAGVRLANTGYFNRAAGGLGYEQLFIIIRDSAADKRTLEEYLEIYPDTVSGQIVPVAHRWPTIPAAAGDLAIDGLQVWKDGPVDLSCRFKVSPIFASGPETDVLEDGEPYLLYMLARDGAFNIGHQSYRLIVDYDSDKPILDFSIGSIDPNVTEPNYEDPNSFEYDGDLHNFFNANSGIRLRLRDDDGLDLGVSHSDPSVSKPSGVSVTMTGFKVIPDLAYPQGKIVPLPAGDWLIELTDEQIKNAFPPQQVFNSAAPSDPENWVRRIVRERQGTITHAMLLNAMKKNAKYDDLFVSPPKDEAYSLPDGLYQITITVRDYNHPGTKLTMNPDEPLDNNAGWAATATTVKSFWIAVDNSPPQIDRQAVEPITGSYIAGTGAMVRGVVRDENGPIAASKLSVTQTVSGAAVDCSDKITFGPANLIRRTSVDIGMWEYDFEIPIDVLIDDLDGTFDYEAVFSDRFGQETRLALSYSIDGIPPTVSLTRAIDTFERDAADLVSPANPNKAALDGLLATRSENKSRLANKIISFTVNPSDNLAVAGVRWWLLPTDFGSDGPAVFTNPSDLGALKTGQAGDGLVLDYYAYPARDPACDTLGVGYNIYNGAAVSANLVGKYGELDMLNGQYTVVIDTDSDTDGKLPDGEYRLHIIAIDSAGNISRSKSEADGKPAESFYQTIFLLQEQDLPYFAEMPPGDMVVGPNGLVLRGMIFEDDGFTDADGNIWPGSINLWYSSDPAATSDVNAINTDRTYTGYIGPIALERENGLTPLGRNLSFNVRMVGLFTEAEIGGDGKKHFIIEAVDSPANKINPDKINPDGTRGPTRPTGNPAHDDPPYRMSNRRHFDFIYDTIPPEIIISFPGSGAAFNKNAADDMDIKGYIEDANLLTYTTRDGVDLGYGISYNIRGKSGMWYLGDAEAATPTTEPYITKIDTKATDPSLADNVTRVYFTIPAAVVTSDINFDDLPAGSNTLGLTVEDKSGKVTPIQVVFIKDVIPPTFSFTNIEEFPFDQGELDDFGIGNWWEVITDPGDEAAMNLLKWQWLNEPENRLSLETSGVIYYDSGVPVLSGTFDDDVSDVDMDSFQYWIDGETGPGRTDKTMNGSGSSWRWSVELVDSGGNALADGVHSIRLEVKDVPGNVLETGMYFFRIDRADPLAAITHINGDSIADGDAKTVFGRRDGFSADDPVFTITGTASDANIREVQLEISERANPSVFVPLDPQNNQNRYIVLAYDPDAPDTITFGSGNPPETVTLHWTFALTRAVYDGLRPGIRYNVRVTAFDEQGNESEEDVWTFVKDDTPPDINFTGLIQGGTANLLPSQLILPGPGITNANANVIMGQTLAIQGVVIDRDNISAITALQGRLERWTWSGTAATGWELVPGNDWADISGADGTSVNVPWIKEFPGLDEGLYRMQVRAKDSAWIATDPASTDWTVGVGGGNPAYSEWLYFFYDRNAPFVDMKVDEFYSLNKTGGTISLTLPISDANRLGRLKIEIVNNNNDDVVSGFTGGGEIVLGDQNIADETQTFTVTFKETSAGAVDDGHYRVRVTATDLAGRTNEAYGNFTLDNTPPKIFITRPSPFKFSDAVKSSEDLEALYPGWKDQYGNGSEILLGGQDETIRGTTEDESKVNANSNVKAVWYHLGFLGGTNFPTEKEIRETVIPAGAADSGTFDDAFDTAANAAAGNAWFKLGGTQVPPGFVVTNGNILDWVLSIPTIYPGTTIDRGGLKIYGSRIEIKGRYYNGSEPVDDPMLRMVHPVPSDLAGRSEIVRMPMWIRVADNAGNVKYEHRDIWFNPNGDRPATSVLNPSSEPKEKARSGTISADGIATNNLAVRNVAFRVKVDANANSVPGAFGPAPSDTVITSATASGGGIVTLMANERLMESELEVTEFLAKIPGGYGTGPWYLANLEVTRGSPVIPWRFSFNSQGEITDLIEKHGFNSVTGQPAVGGQENDTIRVWLEVFAFRGTTHATSISINTEEGGTNDAPLPYVHVFYINKSAPSISFPKVWNGGMVNGTGTNDLPAAWSGDTNWENNPYRYRGAGAELRRGNFALRTTLYSGNVTRNLTEIAIRRAGETYTDWEILWNSSGPSSKQGMTLNWEVPNQRAVLDMRFSTTTSQTEFSLVKELGATGISEWQHTGGRYPIEIRIKDSSPAEVSYTFDFGIDNFTPVADTSVETNPNVAGTNQDFLGRVFDYSDPMVGAAPNAPRRIEKVFAWFTKGSDFVNIRTGATSGAATGTRSVTDNRTASITSGIRTITNEGSTAAISYPATAAGQNQPFNVAGGWVREISEDTAVTGSRMLWIPNGSTNFRYEDVTWIMNIDTTVLPDGPITLHYIVMDAAGNASHFTQPTLVKNKYPRIDKVTLYTDNNGIGAVFTGGAIVNNAFADYELRNHNMSAGYLDSGFISKNEFVGFRVESSSGNKPLNYRLQYVQREEVVLNAAILGEMIADRAATNPTWSDVYTVAVHGDYGTSRWQLLGANTVTLPPVGTHFVAGNFVTGPVSAENYVPESTSAKVWRYKLVPGISKEVMGKTLDGYDNNDPVLPNDVTPPAGAEKGDGFNFKGSAHFGAGKIAQAAGSRPDIGSDPDTTAFFLIKVWDTVDNRLTADERDQLYDALVVGMNVFIEDVQAPTVRLYDLNPYAEPLAVNNNSTPGNLANTIRRALEPRGIGENILRGGLYNDTNDADVELMPSGHIEPRTYTTGTAGPNPLYPWIKTSTGYIAYSAAGLVAGDDPENKTGTGSAFNVSIARDKVSGKIILRGSAHDDQLIREIRIHIGTSADPNLYHLTNGQGMAILRLDESGTAASNPNFRTLQPVPGVAAGVYQEFHWRDGHSVEWSYVWDTEAITDPAGTPVDNMGIWAAAIDYLGGSGKNGQPSAEVNTDNYSTEVFKSTLQTDIVPYVTGFERESRYATQRSRQGWYSFYEGERDIAILGYNLAGSGNTVTLQHGANAVTDVINLPVTSQNKNRVVFNMPEADHSLYIEDDNRTDSGKIILKVGGTQEALNHSTNFNQSWNREDSAIGAELWINRPHAHIWRSRHQRGPHATFFGSNTSISGAANGYGLSTPAMALEYTGTGSNAGRLTAVWAVYGTTDMYYVRGAGRTANAINNAVRIEPSMGTDVSLYNGAIADGAMVFVYERDGRPQLRVRHGDNFGANYRLVRNYGPTKNYMNNRVLRTSGHSHVSTYDALESSLQYGVVTGRSSGSASSNRAEYYIDGRGVGNAATGSIAASADAGLFSAIDYDSTGPVIAYYDMDNDTLRIAYANTMRPTALTNWTRNYVFPTGHAFRSGSGRDVSIKIDNSNGIHLAFKSSGRNTLVYAYAPSRAAPFTAYVVDNSVKGGTRTKVSVDEDGNPWIVYGSSRIGSYDGARIAYRSGKTGIGDERWFDRDVTGQNPAENNSYGWEAVTLPSEYTIGDDRLNIEVWPPTVRGGTLGDDPGWDAVIGYASDRFRLAYFYKPAWKDY